METINKLTGRPYSDRYYTLKEQRLQLPVTQFCSEILSTFNSHQVLILQGETGSGKTTQIPQFLLPHASKCIGITQPRRVAAMSIAQRVSEELDVNLGEEVGYAIRFENCSSPNTKIKYLTDGMLLRESLSDPSLSNYSVVILDEAHQRTVSTDILLGLVKQLLRSREDLKVIIMSATLSAESFTKYFDNAPMLTVPGRLHDIQILYSPDTKDYVRATIDKIMHIHSFEAPGDILAFLTGEEEIETACKIASREIRKYGESVGPLLVLPLYSSLPPEQQQLIFQAPPAANSRGVPGRKCVISTNIAETSITIEGIVYVVDSGLVKEKNYNPRAKLESLLVTPISKSAAVQRTGRAGRTRPGKCFRLYSKGTFSKFKEASLPEILRTSLTKVVLLLKALGIDDLLGFDFIDPPAPECMMRALEALYYLRAFTADCELTDHGRLIVALPVDPEMAEMLLQSALKFSCSEEVLSIAAMLSVVNPFLRPKEQKSQADQSRQEFTHRESGHLTLLNTFNAFVESGKSAEWCDGHFINSRSLLGAVEIREQLRNKLISLGFTIQSNKDPEVLKQCVLSGYFMQVVFQYRPSSYMTVKEKQIVSLHPSASDIEKADWYIYHEFVLTSASYIRTITCIRPEWLLEIAPHYYDLKYFPDSFAKRELLALNK